MSAEAHFNTVAKDDNKSHRSSDVVELSEKQLDAIAGGWDSDRFEVTRSW